MIAGFEKYTSPLTNDEKIIADILAVTLKKQIGKSKAVKNNWISEKCEDWFRKKYNRKISLTGPRMRKIIHHIRVTLLPSLCATEQGYYVAKDAGEMLEYIHSLNQRIGSQVQIYNAAENYYQTKTQQKLNL